MAPMADDLKMRILVEADATAVGRGLATGATQVEAFERRVNQSFARVRKAFDGLSTTQKVVAGVGLGVAVLGTAFAATLRPAIQFESAFAGVRKTVDGTPAQLQAIRKGLLDMSEVMPTSANDLASIAENAGQLGIAAPQVLRFTETIAMLGETTDLDFDSAAQSLARFLNITGNDAPISRIADVIVDLGNNSATTESQIVDFSLRLASAFTTAGAAESEILALASAFSSLGLRSEAGGSALSTIITSISDAAKDGGAELRTYADVAGVLPEQFADIARNDPTEALLQVGEGMGRIVEAGGSLTPILEALGLSGLRTSEVFRLLALNSDFVRSQVVRAAVAFAEGGAAQEEYSRRLETVAAKLQTLRNAITRVAIDIGSVSLEALADGLDFVQAKFSEVRQLLTPLGGEIVELFGNAGEAAGVFFKILGGPTIKLAAASLLGLAGALTVVLEAINALGSTGLILLGLGVLVADLALAGPLSVALAAKFTGLAAATNGLATASTRAATAQSLLNRAMGALPVIAVVAGLAIIGKVMADFRRDVNESAAAYQDDFAGAIEGVDFSNAKRETDQLIARQRELTETAFGSGSAFDRFTYTVQAAAEAVIPLGSNQTVNARKELEGINQALADSEVNIFGYVWGIERLAGILGITNEQAVTFTDTLGIQAAVASASTDEFFSAVDAVRKFVDITDGAAGKVEALNDVLDSSQPTLEGYGEVLGLSAENVARLVQEVDGVDLEDLFSEDAEERAGALAAVSEHLAVTYGAIAAALFDTTKASDAQVEQVFEEISANTDLIASMDELASAIERINSLRAAAQFQTQQLTEAQNAYDEALSAFEADKTEANFIALATAAGNLNAAFAASGVSIEDAVEKNRDLYAALIETGIAAGIAEEDVIRYVSQLTGIPETELTKLVLDGQEAQSFAEEYNDQLAELERERRTQLYLDDFSGQTRDQLDAWMAQWDGRVARAEAEVDEPLDSETRRQNLDAFMAGWDARTARADLEVDADDAQAEIDETRQKLAEVEADPALITIDADGDPATNQIRTVDTGLRLLESNGAIVPIDADVIDALGNIGRVSDATDAYTGADHTATLDADSSPAEASTSTAETLADAFASGDYTAILDANADAARSALRIIEALIKAWRIADYTAVLRADAAPAIYATQVASSFANRFATTRWLAILRADNSQAIRAISQAVGALGAFRSKTITLTTIQRTRRDGENGMILDRAGRVAFADGGSIEALPAGTMVEQPGQARIYAQTGAGRYFAEPLAGPEAYIPLAPWKRPQALAVFDRVGQLLGRFANGGLIDAPNVGRSASASARSSLALSVAITNNITASPGMDEERLARAIGDQVEERIDRVARELENALVG